MDQLRRLYGRSVSLLDHIGLIIDSWISYFRLFVILNGPPYSNMSLSLPLKSTKWRKKYVGTFSALPCVRPCAHPCLPLVPQPFCSAANPALPSLPLVPNPIHCATDPISASPWALTSASSRCRTTPPYPLSTVVRRPPLSGLRRALR